MTGPAAQESMAELLRTSSLRVRSRSPLLGALRKILWSPVGGASSVVIAVLVFTAIFAPAVAPYDPISISTAKFESPSFSHPMGTDNLGRDVLSRILYGSRISLYVAMLAVIFGTLVGSFVGLLSGFVGGWFDLIAQRVVDAVLALPGLVLAMALVAVLGASTTNALLAISIVIVPSTSRVVRSAVLGTKQNVYIEGAYSLGASPARVMLRHILPNVAAPILILISAVLGGAILIETSLSFLGLGTPPPNPSWGGMLSGSGRLYMEQAPWLAIFPGVAISVTVLAFNMLGDVVRDVLDPRLRGSR